MSAIDLINRPTTLGKSSMIVLVVAVLLTVLSFVGYSLQQKTVMVLVDGQAKEVKTFTNTVDEVLKEAQINLAREDVVKPGVRTSLEEGMKISIERAMVVKVLADGKIKEIKTPKTTVRKILEKAEVKLGQKDKVSPALTATTAPGTEIKVIRVAEKLQKVDSQVPFLVERQKDNKISRGIKKLIQQGQPGVRQKVIRITYENGNPVKKEVVSEQIVKKPVPQIVAVGTLTVVSRGGSSFSSSQSMVVTSTAYTHTGNRTATGRKTTRGIVAVDPNVIPLGTRMYVEGYGDAVAADIGSAIKGNKIDVFMETEAEAIQWGRRRVNIHIKD
ncbi:MAG: ubiquitin-like domain-containing protein [Thermincolia bacterium]